MGNGNKESVSNKEKAVLVETFEIVHINESNDPQTVAKGPTRNHVEMRKNNIRLFNLYIVELFAVLMNGLNRYLETLYQKSQALRQVQPVISQICFMNSSIGKLWEKDQIHAGPSTFSFSW